jgi:hypothetical protein
MNNPRLDSTLVRMQTHFRNSWTKWFFYFSNIWSSLIGDEAVPGNLNYGEFIFSYLNSNYLTQTFFNWLFVLSASDKSNFSEHVRMCKQSKQTLESKGIIMTQSNQQIFFSTSEAVFYNEIINLFKYSIHQEIILNLFKETNNKKALYAILNKLEKFGQLTQQNILELSLYKNDLTEDSSKLWDTLTPEDCVNKYRDILICSTQPGKVNFRHQEFEDSESDEEDELNSIHRNIENSSSNSYSIFGFFRYLACFRRQNEPGQAKSRPYVP